MVEPSIKCEFVPITLDNYHKVSDFREEARISQYRDKITQKEIGFFAKHNEKMIGSIWATINKSKMSSIVKTFIELIPNEGLVHDIVTGEQYRGMSVGPFMIGRLASKLLREFGIKRIIIDVNIKNSASLRMMDKAGLHLDHIMFYISLFSKRILHLKLRQYP